jgi:hypothetical protein
MIKKNKENEIFENIIKQIKKEFYKGSKYQKFEAKFTMELNAIAILEFNTIELVVNKKYE